MSVNANNNNVSNNNLGKQEILSSSSLPFISEKTRLSNDRIKEILKDSAIIPGSTDLSAYFQEKNIQPIAIRKTSCSFVVSESAYAADSNSSLIQETLPHPANKIKFSCYIPFEMVKYRNTYYIVSRPSTQIKNVEVYAKKHIQFNGIKLNEKGNSSSDRHIFYRPLPMTNLSYYGQTDYPLADGTISKRPALLFNSDIQGFIDESSLRHTTSPQQNSQIPQLQLSYDLLTTSADEIDAVVNQIKTDPKI